jgi:hypothetical protein
MLGMLQTLSLALLGSAQRRLGSFEFIKHIGIYGALLFCVKVVTVMPVVNTTNKFIKIR